MHPQHGYDRTIAVCLLEDIDTRHKNSKQVSGSMMLLSSDRKSDFLQTTA